MMIAYTILILVLVLCLLCVYRWWFENTLHFSDQTTFKKKLGQSTWFYLHAMADHFPLVPDADTIACMKSHIDGFARFYPCVECRQHMQHYLIDRPVMADSRLQLVRWMFRFHNSVNTRLGKDVMQSDQYVTRYTDMGIEDVDPITGHCSHCSTAI